MPYYVVPIATFLTALIVAVGFLLVIKKSTEKACKHEWGKWILYRGGVQYRRCGKCFDTEERMGAFVDD